MFKVKSNTISKTFNQVLSMIDHTIFPTGHFDNSFKICEIKEKLLIESEKVYSSIAVFNTKLKKESFTLATSFCCLKSLFFFPMKQKKAYY